MAAIFFSVGEASGDAYAAALINRLHQMDDFEFSGVGGPQAERAGMTLVGNSSRWGAVGLFESLKVVPRVAKGFFAAKRVLTHSTPGVFIPIDYGYMNVWLSHIAKANGWRVLYFIPPGSWRKTKQGADLPAVTDAILTPFEWSAEILNSMGANAHWFGHPLKQLVLESQTAAERTGISVLPGSRDHEVKANLRAIADSAKSLGATPIRLAASANLDQEEVLRSWGKISGEAAEIVQPARLALWQSRAAIVCSGTATLESALAGCPCVVVYRVSKATEIEFLIRRPKFDYISLPNILLGRRSVPELIQYDATPKRITMELRQIYDETVHRERMLADFKELNEICGPPDALDKSAEFIAEFVTGSH